MKITASGATDGANIVLFWPDNLPEDADMLLKEDPGCLVEKLRDDGRLIWFLCDGDGEYSVSIYVNSTIPDELKAHCGDEEKYPLVVAKGDAYFGGMEYLFKNDPDFLEKHPGMCDRIEIPEGSYSGTVYRTKLPVGLYHSWIIDRAGLVAEWTYYTTIAFAICFLTGLLASVISLFFVRWTVWYCLVGLTAILLLASIGLSRSKWYKRATEARTEFKKNYPSYLVELQQQ